MSAGSLFRWFQSTAAQHAGQPAFTFLHSGNPGPVTYTYGELLERAGEIGSRLAARGVSRAAPLGILLGSQEDQVLHYLGALSAGAVPAVLTPPNRKLNRAYYQETMSAVLRRCDFQSVITDLTDMDLPTHVLTPYDLAELSDGDVAGREAGGDGSGGGDGGGDGIAASFLQFSSGTTGIKRGVLVPDDAVIAQLKTYAATIGLNDADVIVSWLPLYHDMGFIACMNMPLAHGVHTVMIDPIDWVSNPNIYLRAVSTYGGTLSWHPNFAFAFMAQAARRVDLEGVDLSSLRGLMNCSEPVTYESQQSFLERYVAYGLSPEVFKGCYAMAETTFALTYGESTDPDYLDPTGPQDGTRSPSPHGSVSVGCPLAGVELAIVDPQSFDPLPDRSVGEIWVRSPFNFSGYHNDPEATRAAFVDGWYRTGDLGYRVGDAYHVAGRLKDVLIVGGVNVFPQDIEDLVSSIDGVHPGRVSAFSTFDERFQTERVVILAEADHHDFGDPAEQDPGAVRALAQEIHQHVLGAFQTGNVDVQLLPPGWLIKSTSGKMARSANRDKWLAERR